MGFETHAAAHGAPLIMEGTQFGSVVPDQQVAKILSTIASTTDQLALALLSEPRQNWATDCTPLRKTPLLELNPGRFVCPDRGLLYRCLTDKIYFLLEEAYPDNTFHQLFGYVFEGYANRLIENFSYTGQVLERNFFAAPVFRLLMKCATDCSTTRTRPS